MRPTLTDEPGQSPAFALRLTPEQSRRVLALIHRAPETMLPPTRSQVLRAAVDAGLRVLELVAVDPRPEITPPEPAKAAAAALGAGSDWLHDPRAWSGGAVR